MQDDTSQTSCSNFLCDLAHAKGLCSMTHSSNVQGAEEVGQSALVQSLHSHGNDQQSTTSPLESQSAFKPGRSLILAFTSICIITLAAALDATSLSIALPIITERVQGTAIQAFWSGTSFLISSAVFQPVIGGLSHGFGRKQVSSPVFLST